uniref:THH1/TOM1/TOM3 domain-containing protein n=1 Tax=Chlamydomonas leiostraca TaxID=1034604 RepID=A0A7S0R8K2_9CHLO|mmetsp:Transcript_16577/g.41384  ORF Transcript_16577/g.41384 Transcript_16577/m.41384 type:complete len:299 (+) Transcript_16577:190-1086(+)
MVRPAELLGGQLQQLDFPALPDWWHKIDDSPEFQEYSNYGLAISYALIGVVALVQLVRIHLRVPEYGWTTQKVFHLLNMVVCFLRTGIFVFRPQMEGLHPVLIKLMLLDLPGLVFFTTYTLLVLFWAEIYHQARSMPTGSLRPVFVGLNICVYGIQGGLWVLSSWSDDTQMQQLGYIMSDIFLALVSVSAAVGFLLYGGRLFLMLQRFPIESRGRRKKLREVGLVTSICAGCFSVRALVVALSAFDRTNLELDLMGHPLLNLLYYSAVEVAPTACVLYILRKLPPKRATQGYTQIPSQ